MAAQCLGSTWLEFSTVEEAVAVASFAPVLPGYLPDGFKPSVIRHTRPDWFDPDWVRVNCPCDPRLSHNDQIGIYYRDAAGRQLVIVQGFPGHLPFHEAASPENKGVIQIGDQEAYWMRGLPLQGFGNNSQLHLHWEVGRVGLGWQVSPDRSDIQYGSPLSYSIVTDSLSLEELIAVAESMVRG
jgi:hypothetical protein